MKPKPIHLAAAAAAAVLILAVAVTAAAVSRSDTDGERRADVDGDGGAALTAPELAEGTPGRAVATPEPARDGGAGSTAGLAFPESFPSPNPPVSPGRDGVTVSGVAAVDVEPDRAEWSFGVQAEADTAREALRESSERAAAVAAALRDAGVRSADIRTEQVSVWPRHDEHGHPDGFIASNTVRALVRDLDRAGAVVDAAVAAGANGVSGPGLAVGDRDDLYHRALAAAYGAAREKAEALAARTGRGLGPAVSIVEAGGGEPVYALDSARGSESAGVAVPIEPGVMRVSAAITVTFALEGATG